MRRVTMVVVLVSSLALAQGRPGGPPQPPGPPGPPPAGMMGAGPMGMGPGGMHGMFNGPPGIPPQVAQKLGIPPETVKKVRELGFDANEALIPLEGDLKKAQLELERTMSAGAAEEAQVFPKLEAIAKAELAVRKNRVGLLLKIRKLLGPDVWEKLMAEMPAPEMMHGGPGGPGGPGMGGGMMHRELVAPEMGPE